MTTRVTGGIAVMAMLLAACSSDSGGTAPHDVPRSMEVVSGGEQHAPVGTMLPQPVIIRVVDAEGRPVPDQLVNFVVVAGGGQPFVTAVQTDTAGRATDRWTLGTTAGEQRMEARIVDQTTAEPIVVDTATAIADPGPVDTLEVGGGAVPMNVWASVRPLVEHAADKYGNVVDSPTVSITASSGWSVSHDSIYSPVEQNGSLVITAGSVSDTATIVSLLDLRTKRWRVSWSCYQQSRVYVNMEPTYAIDSVKYQATVDSIKYLRTDGGSFLSSSFEMFLTGTGTKWETSSGPSNPLPVTETSVSPPAVMPVNRQAPGAIIVDPNDGDLAQLVSTNPYHYSGTGACDYGVAPPAGTSPQFDLVEY